MLIGPELRRLLAVAVLGALISSCASGATAKSPAPSHSTTNGLSASPSPSEGPAANKSCPAANSHISTDQPIEALIASQTPSSAEHALQSLLDQYRGLKVLVLPFTGSGLLSWDNLSDGDLPDLITYGKLFICEWAKYSPIWVNGSRITKVALVKNLNNPTRGPCKASGLADWSRGTLYQDVLCGGGPVKQKHTLHHEFWHLAASNLVDPGWLALNDPSFVYGNSGWDPVEGWGPGTVPHHPRPGFVSAYSMQNSYEDAAETYASMLVKEEYPMLLDWIATDSILKSKVEYLKQVIVSIDPAMNGSYLDRAGQS